MSLHKPGKAAAHLCANMGGKSKITINIKQMGDKTYAMQVEQRGSRSTREWQIKTFKNESTSKTRKQRGSRSTRMLKCCKNTSDTLCSVIASCATILFFPHFDFICELFNNWIMSSRFLFKKSIECFCRVTIG